LAAEKEQGHMTKKLWVSAALVLTGSLLVVETAQAQTGPLSFFPVTPCRLADTRGAVGPSGGPALAANQARGFPILTLCNLPSTAVAVVFNVTIVQPNRNGNLRAYPAGTPAPNASILNWLAGDGATANGAIVPVGTSTPPGNHVVFQNDMPLPGGAGGTVHLIIDTSGYFQ
jgi:hypothetical protein